MDLDQIWYWEYSGTLFAVTPWSCRCPIPHLSTNSDHRNLFLRLRDSGKGRRKTLTACALEACQSVVGVTRYHRHCCSSGSMEEGEACGDGKGTYWVLLLLAWIDFAACGQRVGGQGAGEGDGLPLSFLPREKYYCLDWNILMCSLDLTWDEGSTTHDQQPHGVSS